MSLDFLEIHLVSLCLFIGEFNLFTFNVIINWCGITVVILLTVSVLVVLYISSSRVLLFEVFVVIFKSYLLMGVP